MKFIQYFISILYVFILSLIPSKLNAQDCATLYLCEGANRIVYSINPLTGTKTQVSTLVNSGQNLSVGPDPASPSNIVFTSSNSTIGSPIYRQMIPLGANIPTDLFGLTATISNGFAYGISPSKNLIEINTNGVVNLGAITSDSYFAGATLSEDGFFNTAGELNVFAIKANFIYLYKIDLVTRIASVVVQVAGKLPSTYDGIAFLNNNVYIASFLAKNGGFGMPATYFAEIFELNPLTGISKKMSDVDLGVNSFQSSTFPIDLASCENFSQPSPNPNCNTLYGIISSTGKTYKIDLSTQPPLLIAGPIAAANQGNLAVGPEPANLNRIRYLTSQNSVVGPIYQGIAPLTNTGNNWGPTSSAAPIGIATQAANGISYGINSKNLTSWTGTGNATLLGAITSADPIWTNANNTDTNGWILNDIGVDAPGNLYVVIMQGTNTATTVHLFRVDPLTRIATLVRSSAVGALIGTDAGKVNGNGLAYLNDGFYISRNNETSWTEMWKMDAVSGSITQVAVGSANRIANKILGDLATCATVTKILANFVFNCSGASLQTDLYAVGTPQKSVIRIPIAGAVSGQAEFNVFSDNGDIFAIPQPYTATILNGDTFVDIPITYSGASPSGTRVLTVTSNISGAGTCSFNINICDGMPAVFSYIHPTCATSTGTMTVISPVGADMEYSINGGATFQSSPIFSGLSSGFYPFVRKNNSTGCSLLSDGFTISAIPSLPNVPTASVTHPSCTVPLGSILFTPQTGVEYSIGGVYQSSPIFAGVVPGTYTLSVRDVSNPLCFITGTNTLTINAVTGPSVPPMITANPASEFICSNDITNISLYSNVPNTVFNWSVVQTNVTGATAGTGSNISQVLRSTGDIQGTVVYTVTPFANGCQGVSLNLTVTVTPSQQIALKNGSICINPITGSIINCLLDTGLSNSDYNFAWYFNGNAFPITGANDSTYEAHAPGLYTVKVSDSMSGCVLDPATANVTESYPGIINELLTNSAFSPNSTITVTMIPPENPDYLYSLDDGPSQQSNVFTYVNPGMHTIHVTDSNGCTDSSGSVRIIGYPNYFTPNGDGINDFWNITGINSAKIYIFDRYGKLITMLTHPGNGWDGTYNRQALPSTDYWFTVEYREFNEVKLFRAHFSLKR